MKKNLFLALLTLILSTSSYAADPKASLESLKSLLTKTGSAKLEGTDQADDKTVPALFFGSQKINNNYVAVDEVKKLHSGTATVFVKSGAEYIRIATNVLKSDGTRAVGTALAHNAAFDAINKGHTFCGVVEILGNPFDTCYEPIKDAAGATIGIYYVGFIKS